MRDARGHAPGDEHRRASVADTSAADAGRNTLTQSLETEHAARAPMFQAQPQWEQIDPGEVAQLSKDSAHEQTQAARFASADAQDAEPAAEADAEHGEAAGAETSIAAAHA